MAANVIIHDSSEDKQPEKYGRTLARDIEILKEGGIPDLAPLAQSAPKERPATPPPVEGPPSPPHAHTLTPPLVTPIEPHYSSKERLVAASPITPIPPTPVPPTESPPSLPRARTPVPPLVSPIKTYSGDFLEMVKETHASTATVLAAEQDKKQKWVPQEAPKKSRSNLLYIIAGAVLLIAGGAGAYVAYTRYLSAVVPIVPTFGARAPIFVDEREQISSSGSVLFKAVETSLARPPTPNAVRLLYNTDTNIFSTLLAGAPDIVLRNTNADGSMAGIVNAGGSTSVFFILSVSSYSNTFSGMLFWEKSMPRDLAALWGAYPALSSATATTSPASSGKTGSGQATTTAARVTSFRDEVIANHDARVYRDSAGRSVLLYGYWNQSTLVIARDPAAFAEILQRLATSRAQ
jgi:hypothetical protein